jgi:hypothetical protein
MPAADHAQSDEASCGAKNISITGRASAGPEMSRTRSPASRPRSKLRKAQQRDSAATSSRVRCSMSGVSRSRRRSPSAVAVRAEGAGDRDFGHGDSLGGGGNLYRAPSTRLEVKDQPSPMSAETPELLLTIGQVADQAGLRASHIRFYEKIGVLPEPERVSG